MRKTVSLLLALELSSLPAMAQQPRQESAKKAATVTADNKTAPADSDTGRRARLWTGALLSVAGGTAIVLGTTVIKSTSTTSGNTPPGTYQSCVALKTNPVYRDNQCDDLRGPNNGLLFGGIAAAAAGITLLMLGSSKNEIRFGPRSVSFRHRMSF